MYIGVCVSVCLYVRIYVCVYVSTYLSFYLSIYITPTEGQNEDGIPRALLALAARKAMIYRDTNRYRYIDMDIHIYICI